MLQILCKHVCSQMTFGSEQLILNESVLSAYLALAVSDDKC